MSQVATEWVGREQHSDALRTMYSAACVDGLRIDLGCMVALKHAMKDQCGGGRAAGVAQGTSRSQPRLGLVVCLYHDRREGTDNLQVGVVRPIWQTIEEWLLVVVLVGVVAVGRRAWEGELRMLVPGPERERVQVGHGMTPQPLTVAGACTGARA